MGDLFDGDSLDFRSEPGLGSVGEVMTGSTYGDVIHLS